MSWSYTGDPSASDKDAVRFYLGDTDAASPELQDAEIAWALRVRGSAFGATAMCALALAAKYARLTSISADGVSQGLNQKTSQFQTIAAQYQRKESLYRATPTLFGISKSDIESTQSDPDRVPDIFKIGISDNRLPTLLPPDEPLL